MIVLSSTLRDLNTTLISCLILDLQSCFRDVEVIVRFEYPSKVNSTIGSFSLFITMVAGVLPTTFPFTVTVAPSGSEVNVTDCSLPLIIEAQALIGQVKAG